MSTRFTVDFIVAALIRAIKTMAQVTLSMITIGVAITGINWPEVLAIAATSGVYSLLTSISFGIPEGEFQGSLTFSKVEEPEGNVVAPVLKFDIPGDELLDRSKVNIKVEKEI